MTKTKEETLPTTHSQHNHESASQSNGHTSTQLAQNGTPSQTVGGNRRAQYASSSQALAPNGSGQNGYVAQPAQRRSQSQLMRNGSPFGLMRQMMDEMDRFSEAFGMPSPRRLGFPTIFDVAPRTWSDNQTPTMWSPPIEILERDGQLVVHADLPGLKKEDVQIEVQDDVLTLRGERKSQHEENRQGVYRSERSYGTFQRSFQLPEGTDPLQLKARFQDGVLEINLPKPQPQQAQPHRVEIE